LFTFNKERIKLLPLLVPISSLRNMASKCSSLYRFDGMEMIQSISDSNSHQEVYIVLNEDLKIIGIK